MSNGNTDWNNDQGATPPPGHQHPVPPPGYQQVPPGYSSYGQPAYGQPAYGPAAQSHGRATASMVVGIVGLVSMFFCYGLVSIITGPIAFFLGRSADKEIAAAPQFWSNSGMAKAGWIMGLIQTILSVLIIGAIAIFFIWAISVDDSNF